MAPWVHFWGSELVQEELLVAVLHAQTGKVFCVVVVVLLVDVYFAGKVQ